MQEVEGRKIHSEETKKKISIANLGRKRTSETRLKMSLAKKGHIPWNKGLKGKQVAWNKGLKGYLKGRKITWADKISVGKKNSFKSHLASIKAGKDMGLNNKGKKLSENHKNKLSSILTGRIFIRNGKPMQKNNHPSYINGESFNPYPREFNRALRLKIRKRDNFTCCLCRKTEQEEKEEFNRILSVNHIDFDKNNNNQNNLNTLCVRCNTKINKNRDYWKEYFKT